MQRKERKKGRKEGREGGRKGEKAGQSKILNTVWDVCSLFFGASKGYMVSHSQQNLR
jgi:hypothetical protein